MGQNRQIGPVTGAATAGGGLGAAIAQIIIHFWPYLEPVESAVTVVLTVVLALVGGYLIPPKDPADGVILEDLDLDHTDEHPAGDHAGLVD